MSIGNLLALCLRVKYYNFKLQIHVIYRYYRKVRFALIDISLLLCYFFINPYKTSKKFLKNRNIKNIHAYGETPLTTFEKIISNSEIKSHDTFLELGSGRGRLAFWLHEFIGCTVKAAEWIPTFHKIAFFINKIFKCKNLSFYCADMFNLEFKDLDVIFLYGTCLEDMEIHSLIDKFKKPRSKFLKVITISYPLTDYDSSFHIIKQFPVSFSWGKTTCYINGLASN